MAKQQAMGIKEFQKRFNDEDECRNHLFNIRWGKGFVCPKCGHNEYYNVSGRITYQCKKCRHQTSVTAGTVMDRTHLKLSVWFWAIYLVSKDKRGCSAMQIANELDLTYSTAWYLVHRIRKAMVNRDEAYVLSNIWKWMIHTLELNKKAVNAGVEQIKLRLWWRFQRVKTGSQCI